MPRISALLTSTALALAGLPAQATFIPPGNGVSTLLNTTGAPVVVELDANSRPILVPASSFAAASGSTTSTPAETLAVTTPAAQTAGAQFTLAGTYTNGPPAALDYSVNGGTFTAATSPTIGSGAFSFPVTLASAGSTTIAVRDHNATGVSATSASFTVAAAAQSGPALTQVQYAVGASDSSTATATLGAKPTVGNTLLLFTEVDNGGTPTIPAGYTQVGTTGTAYGSNYAAFVKTVTSSDAAALSIVFSTGETAIALVELAGYQSGEDFSVSGQPFTLSPKGKSNSQVLRYGLMTTSGSANGNTASSASFTGATVLAQNVASYNGAVLFSVAPTATGSVALTDNNTNSIGSIQFNAYGAN